MDFKQIIAQNLNIKGISIEEIKQSLLTPPSAELGDFAFPCFKLAKAFCKNPVLIAKELAQQLAPNPFIERVVSEGGYLNFYLNKGEAAKAVVSDIAAAGADYGKQQIGQQKTICIDYSSINIAKPFHIGHLSTTVIGGSLYRIFQFLGYNVVGINHLGDWGTQFGKLIAAFLRWGSEEDIENRSINALLEYYIRFHEQVKIEPQFEDEGRKWFKKIEQGDKTALQIFEKFKTITLKEVEKTYKKLGVVFDSYNGESFFNDKMDEIVDILRQKNLLIESEGAQVVDLSEYGIPPCLILKKDGASLYATRDLAAALYRKRTYNFDKNLYVVAYQQNLHFRQVFKVLELMGFEWAKDCEHIPFGMVSLPEGQTLSTREGRVVFLEDVLNQAIAKTKQTIIEKSPNLENIDQTAQQIGIGAVVFCALSSSRIKDIVFNYDIVLNFEGETGPYLMYTHARCASVLQKDSDSAGADLTALCDSEAFELVKQLAAFPDKVKDAAQKYEPSILARHLVDIAQAYNKFYFEHKILVDEPNIRKARIALTAAVKTVLKQGMRLILLDAPEKM